MSKTITPSLRDYVSAGVSEVHGDAEPEDIAAIRVGGRLLVVAAFEVSS